MFGNSQELEAYHDCLNGVLTAETPAWANKPAQSALWYLTRAGSFSKSLGATVTLYPAAQRRCCIHQPIPAVSVVHDLGQLTVTDKYDPLRMFYFKQIALRLIKSSARQVAISRSTRDEMAGALGIAKDSIPVVPNGVNYDRFAPLEDSDPRVAAARASTGLSEPYLLYPARLEHPAKNHLRLLEAFAHSSLKDTHLLALSGGDWGGKALIEKHARELRIESRVRLLGYVAEEHLPGLIAGAEVIIMVGLTEGFGLPALEGLASGRAICAANAGALPEVVGSLAALCDPMNPASIGEALERAAGDAELRQRCASEGPGWAKKWGWDVTARGLVDVCLDAASAAH